LQEYASQISEAGASLIAISSDSQSTTKETVQDLSLSFTVLSDSSVTAISAYNVVDRGNIRIARPATYIIKSDGTVGWKSLGSTTTRVSTADTITALGEL